MEKVNVPTNEVVNTLVQKKGKMVKSSKKAEETVEVPDKDMAARRVIRDFLSNRLTFYTKPPQPQKTEEEKPKSKAADIKPKSKKITKKKK